jgi:hypothetical protein
MSDRTFPANPEPEPTTLAGHPVVRFTRIGARIGELPNLGIAIGREGHRPEHRAYAVWHCAFRDGKWIAFEGCYNNDRAAADEEFDRRVRLAT